MIKTLLSTAAILLAIAHANVQAAVSLNLTTQGTNPVVTGSVTANDIFTRDSTQPAGSGVIRSFVRISTNDDIVQGYNTDSRPLQFDENNSGNFTRSISLGDFSTVSRGGVDYRAFLLDINQQNSDSLLSLNELQIFLGNTRNLSGASVGAGGTLSFGSNAFLVYDLDSGIGGDATIELDYSLNSGSGQADMIAYIRDSLFQTVLTAQGSAFQYVYLYSSFGDPNNNNDGYEEWAVRSGTLSPAVPEPSTIITALAGLLPLGIIGLRRRLRRKGEVPA